jgi:hypothetical protein
MRESLACCFPIPSPVVDRGRGRFWVVFLRPLYAELPGSLVSEVPARQSTLALLRVEWSWRDLPYSHNE